MADIEGREYSRSFCFYYTVCHLAVTKYAKKIVIISIKTRILYYLCGIKRTNI